MSVIAACDSCGETFFFPCPDDDSYLCWGCEEAARGLAEDLLWDDLEDEAA